MTDRLVLHVGPDGLQGGWRVERIGTGEADHFETREEAEAAARERAQGSEVAAQIVVHDQDGRIASEWKSDAATPSNAAD